MCVYECGWVSECMSVGVGEGASWRPSSAMRYIYKNGYIILPLFSSSFSL
jgi:hypothetical protein